MSLRLPKVRGSLLLAGAIGVAVLMLGALSLTPAISSVQAQTAAVSSSCSPYDSGCFYCQNHPTSSICPMPPSTANAAAAVPANQAATAASVVVVSTGGSASTSVPMITLEPAACGPFLSGCTYCQNHPDSSFCKP